jgi:hypothetical protein
LHSVSALHTFYAPTANMANFIPGMGFEPPVFTDEMCGGAAARAAAAAQNKSSRNISAADSKIFDSESGIGIDLRSSDLSDSEPSIARIGEYYLVQPCMCSRKKLTPCRSGSLLAGRAGIACAFLFGPKVIGQGRMRFQVLE